jgi:hypothetical protein
MVATRDRARLLQIKPDSEEEEECCWWAVLGSNQ